MPSIRHTAGRLSLGETWMLVWRSNHPSHRSAARLSPPIRKRQEGYFKKTKDTPTVRLRIGGAADAEYSAYGGEVVFRSSMDVGLEE